MLALVASVLLAAAATPPPFTVATPTPAPNPFGLPEIGHVRSAAPVCTALREVVNPALPAVKRADVRFTQLAKTDFPNYIAALDDPDLHGTVAREAALARLDADVTTMLEESNRLRKALGDPRLLSGPSDPDMQALRTQLGQLYDYQSGRANLLFEFVQRERVDLLKAGVAASASGLGGRTSAPTPAPEPTESPTDMPEFHGIEMQDKSTGDSWTGEINRQIVASETQAVRTLLPIVRTCH